MRQPPTTRSWAAIIVAGKVLLFAGWLFPFWLSTHFMLQAWRIDETNTSIQNSFPFIAAAGDAMTVSVVWLTIAIAIRVATEK